MNLFWLPGRPKRSIVANWAPKMTPKWSPKWSQSDNGRPLRNMHRHCRIAYPPPLGELHFHCFFRVPQKVTKQRLKKNHFEKKCAKLDQKVPLLGARPKEKWVSFFGFVCSGGAWEPHLSTESLKVTLGAPKCLPKLSKIVEKYIKIIMTKSM